MNSKRHQQRNHIQKIIVFSLYNLYTFGPQIHQILLEKTSSFPYCILRKSHSTKLCSSLLVQRLSSIVNHNHSMISQKCFYAPSCQFHVICKSMSCDCPVSKIWDCSPPRLPRLEMLGLEMLGHHRSGGHVGSAGDVGSWAGSRQGPLQTPGSQSLNFLVLAIQHPLLDARCNVPLFRRFRTTKYPSFLSSLILAIFLRGSGSSGILANHGSSIRSHAVLCLVVSRLPGQKKLSTKWAA